MKEIVTVQVGGFANFVGSHFWNFQDEILGLAEPGYGDSMVPTTGLDMDVLFRIGETRQGRSTYTPRLLSIDLRGSSGAVSSSGTLYEGPPSVETSSVTTWDGPATTFRLESHERNRFLQSLDNEEEGFQNGGLNGPGQEDVQMADSYERDQALVESLEEGVQYWTDYLKVHLHPSTIYQIPGVWQGATPFEDYGCGRELLSGQEQAEDVRDKVRLLVEESDHMQGFQFFVDDSGGFSSVGADVIDDVVEEYGRTPIFLFTLRPPDELAARKGSLVHNLHDSVSLARLGAAAQVTVPMGLPQIAKSAFAEHLLIQEQKQFHTGAVYAAAINCITLPFRMEVAGPLVTSQVGGLGNVDMGTALRLLSCSSARQVALMEAAFPAPAVPDSESDKAYSLQKLYPLTPSIGTDTSGVQIAEMLVVQGAQLSDSSVPATVPQVHESLARACDRLARARTNPKRGLVLSHLAISPCPLAIPLPFPCIFSRDIGRHGEILSRPAIISGNGRGGLDINSSPVIAKVSTSGAILPYIKKRREDIQRLGLARATAGASILEDWGFAREEVEELSETLSKMVHAYGDSDSDSSDFD